jgi:hypothetical protein
MTTAGEDLLDYVNGETFGVSGATKRPSAREDSFVWSRAGRSIGNV